MSAKSTADFISKMTTMAEEADETLFWLELVDSDPVAAKTLAALMDDAEQILRMIVTSSRAKNG
jgi:four helix bundle protein